MQFVYSEFCCPHVQCRYHKNPQRCNIEVYKRQVLISHVCLNVSQPLAVMHRLHWTKMTWQLKLNIFSGKSSFLFVYWKSVGFHTFLPHFFLDVRILIIAKVLVRLLLRKPVTSAHVDISWLHSHDERHVMWGSSAYPAENQWSENRWWRQCTQFLWFLFCWLSIWSQPAPVMWTWFLKGLSVIQIRGRWKERRKEGGKEGGRERSLRDD